jgi:two-component system CheB/CheR fusion protein
VLSQTPLHILLVEDEPATAAVAALLLRLLGHQVAVAPDGYAALRLAEACPPDVVLLDLALPGMGGHELAGLLRRQFRSPRPFLVALTGYGQEDDFRRSRAAGIDLHLVKPVDEGQLTQLLNQVQRAKARRAACLDGGPAGSS